MIPALRSNFIASPARVARELLGKEDINEVAAILTSAGHSRISLHHIEVFLELRLKWNEVQRLAGFRLLVVIEAET
jgi:hypothetical protein